MKETKKSGLATAGLVLGIIAISTSFIPIINNASFVMGILSTVFGIIPFIKKINKGKALTALILGILSIVITLSLQNSWSNSLNNISNEFDTMTGENTDEVLKKVDVNFGDFEVKSSYGFNETKLTVKITNKTTEKKSFNFTIEAVNSDGTRIDTDYIYATELAANQSQTFDIFKYVSEEKINDMKMATFNVVEASMY